ncbi:hypothetical protein C0J52_14865 [Blattella germanica]|nr:hypothetical protein C0J52_14865 [Blattella germanica]
MPTVAISLREMVKRRVTLLEGEVRYYVHQILQGLLYLHQKKIAHQNLKLENILLDYDMTVKISNFRLAFKVHDNSQKRQYTLLLGKEPLESSLSGDANIVIPSHISKQANDMLRGYIPKQLPRSCIAVPPRKSELYKPGGRPPLREIGQQNENTDPASRPAYFIMAHSGFSEKCGFGYKLNDGSIGVLFNDNSNLILLSNGLYVQYVSQIGRSYYYTIEKFPNILNRKMEILCYIRRKLRETSSFSPQVKESDCLSRLPYVDFRNERILILCPYMAAVTYINVSRQWSFTYTFSSIEQNGCNRNRKQHVQEEVGFEPNLNEEGRQSSSSRTDYEYKRKSVGKIRGPWESIRFAMYNTELSLNTKVMSVSKRQCKQQDAIFCV